MVEDKIKNEFKSEFIVDDELRQLLVNYIGELKKSFGDNVKDKKIAKFITRLEEYSHSCSIKAQKMFENELINEIKLENEFCKEVLDPLKTDDQKTESLIEITANCNKNLILINEELNELEKLQTQADMYKDGIQKFKKFDYFFKEIENPIFEIENYVDKLLSEYRKVIN